MTTGRRFLFVMHYPGYLRYFDSAIRELVARGHHVDVAFDSPHKQPEGGEALDGVANVEVLGKMPPRGDLWPVVGRALQGTIDYARYLHPDFRETPYLRRRMASALPPVARRLTTVRGLSAASTNRVTALLGACVQAIPSSATIAAFLDARRIDAVIVSPLVVDRSPQIDVVTTAKAMGIPTALCVASWDHLTTKGLTRVQPDLVTVWNEEQKAEAAAYHHIDPARVVVTGAIPFDRWFERRPTAREAFCRKVGLPADRPFVLFAGSTASISAPEAEMRFVRRWIAALRRQPGLEHVGILVRPHPYNAAHWAEDGVLDAADAVVYPRAANPVNEHDRQDYFDSLFHSAAVVGVNTTAMIEAAIVGRTVHTVLADDFRDTQEGTLHFRYLLAENGGFLRVADRLEAHAQQVAETVASPDIGRAACARFVSTFVRPHGLDTPTTPIVADALERLAAAGRRAPARPALYVYPLRLLLWGAIAVLEPYRLTGWARKRLIIWRRRATRSIAKW